ncbi:hypothetical protein ES708_19606 [subsurface metagenome]
MKGVITIIYGLLVMGIGIWRNIQTGHSPEALWFGLVMGTIAIIGGILLVLKKRIPAYIVTFVAIGFVGGWFLYRILTHSSDGVTSLRVWIILVATVTETIILLNPVRKAGNRGHSS